MIKRNKGDMHIEGNGAEILADISCIMYTLRKHIPEQVLLEAVYKGFEVFEKGESIFEEDEDETEVKSNPLDKLIEFLERLVDTMEDEDEDGEDNG